MAPEHISATSLRPLRQRGVLQPRASGAEATASRKFTAAARSAHFSIAISRALGTVVVTVHGDLDPPGAKHLGSVLADLIYGQGNLDVVVDLHDASAAKGLEVFAAAAKQASQRGAALSLCDPPTVFREALIQMGLGQLVRSSRADGRRAAPVPPLGRISALRDRSAHPSGQLRSRLDVQADSP